MSSEREIVSSRILDAPRDVVFCAFYDPAILARWWGPSGFTNTFVEFDPRPGGAWHFVMRGPDGAEYPTEKRFIEVVRDERIVVRHEDPTHGFEMTISFEDEGTRTRLIWRMRFDAAEEAQRVRSFVVEANEQNLDRLAAELLAHQ